MPEARTNNLNDDALRNGLDRLDELANEKDRAMEGMAEVLAELEAAGHPKKVVRQLLTLRRMSDEKRTKVLQDHELFDAYINSLNF